MSDRIFESLEPRPDCVSAWRLSRAVMGALPSTEMAAVEAHLATCTACAERFAAERAVFAAAQDTPLPASLRPSADILAFGAPAGPATTIGASKALPRRSPARFLALASVLALAALTLIVTRPPAPNPTPDLDPPTERAKGQLDLRVAVQRKGVLIKDVAVAAVGPLAIDDQLRLRVSRSAGTHIVVAAFEANTWAELFRGVAPEDGWLPLGLVVTAGEAPRLRVLACPNDPPSGAAFTETVLGGCSRIDHAFEVQ